MVTIEPGGVFGPLHHHVDRPGTVYMPAGLARGQEYHALAREQRGDLRGGDLGRHRQAKVASGATFNMAQSHGYSGTRLAKKLGMEPETLTLSMCSPYGEKCGSSN